MLKVLLIDDDEFTNELYEFILKKEGVTVDVRTSGVDALEYLQVCRLIKSFPDVMLVDINMPGINGFHFIKHYENNFMRDSTDMKIIIISSSVLQKDIDEALSYKSVKGFWNKPLTTEKIQGLIEAHK
jgi:CheY-like chemotaxis protein